MAPTRKMRSQLETDIAKPGPTLKTRRKPLVPRGSGRTRDFGSWRAGGGMSRGALFRPGGGGTPPGEGREPVLASWWRSRRWNVAADHIDLSYVSDPDLDTPLTRSASAVLRSLRDNLEGQPISVILTDAPGVVLSRQTADHDPQRY